MAQEHVVESATIFYFMTYFYFYFTIPGSFFVLAFIGVNPVGGRERPPKCGANGTLIPMSQKFLLATGLSVHIVAVITKPHNCIW